MPPCSIAIWDRLFRTHPALLGDPVSTNVHPHLPLSSRTYTNTSLWTLLTSLRFLPPCLPLSVVLKARLGIGVKVGCSAKVNSGGIVAPSNVGYMMSLAKSWTRVEGHTWTFVAICLLSLVLPSGASLSPGGGPLPLGEWQLYNTPHLFSKQRHELEHF